MSSPNSAGDNTWEQPTARLHGPLISPGQAAATAVTEPAAASAETVPPGKTFGNYELLQEIGRGGMGVVFKARQVKLGRIVALKMILPGSLPTPEDLQRFHTEAEATARLQHPNIVTVHEVGQVEGQFFYSMDFINGPSLAQRLIQGPLAARVAARYVQQIAAGLQHAHRHQILHRDIKPSNILLDADDQPHLTDFGLAKKLGDTGQTRTGSILGTPSYMAPEQASGRIKELGPPCDVYGLGALLYELLTGRPPFRAETPMDTLMQVLQSEPAPPRLLNPKLDRDLETICLKCLEKDPSLRYPTAEALAQDLQHYLNGESISARSFNVLDRLTRTLGRSQYDVEFRSWGNMLLIFAAIVFVEHLVVYALTRGEEPYPLRWIMLARGTQFALMGFIFWRHRARRLLPTTGAERQLWSIWLGYVVACMVVVFAARVLEVSGGRTREELGMFPVWSVLSGLCFFIMGSNYWGRCYVYGTLFFGLALVMPLDELRWAPLEFGGMWTGCLVNMGLHLRRIGKSEG